MAVELWLPQAKGRVVLLERWRFDADNLRRLARKDRIGWGYQLTLPWGTHRPGIEEVVLRAEFTPKGGGPLGWCEQTVRLVRP